MIVEHLLSRDITTPLLVADVPPAGGNGGERSLEQQQQRAPGHDEGNAVTTAVRLAAMAAFTGDGGLSESAAEMKPGMNGVAGQEPATAGGGGGGDGNSDGDWEVYQPAAFGVGGGGGTRGDFVAGCGGVDVGEVIGGGGAKVGRRTWRDRFVGSGGIDALVELVLTRDWDATRGYRDCGGGGRGWPGESTAAISLACLALLLVLLERFMEEGYLPEPRQLTRLVRRWFSRLTQRRLIVSSPLLYRSLLVSLAVEPMLPS